MSKHHGCGREAAKHLVEQLVDVAGAKCTDRVMVVGGDQIEVLVELAGRGFLDASCHDAAGGRKTKEASADIVVAPSLRSEAELLAILSWLRRALRQGTRLLIGTAGSPSAAWTRRLPELLARHGFSVLREGARPVGLRILCCQKSPRAQVQAA